MKRLLLIVLPLLLIVGCSKEPINYETTLIERDEIFYTKDTNKPYSGQVFSLYNDGKKKGDGILKDGKMISKTEWEYYGNGEKKSEETFKNGKRDGLLSFWDKNNEQYQGVLMIYNGSPWREPLENGSYLVRKKEGSYIKTFFNIKDSLRDGQFIRFIEDGQKVYKTSFKKGIIDGLFTKWNEDGQKYYEGIVKNGKEDGLHTSWDYFNGEKEKLIDYKNGKSINEWTFRYLDFDDGGKLEESLKDGKKDGFVTQWYENGQKKSEVPYKDGKEDGTFTSWYENGQKKGEGTWKDGKQDGLWTGWYENGQKKGEGTFKDGNLISLKEWNEDGSVKE